MESSGQIPGLEMKFCKFESVGLVGDDAVIAGYASVFGSKDQSGDQVAKGAFAASLAKSTSVKMLWQHDPAQPIGVWDEIREDASGLFVKGRLLTEVQAGREALALLKAGAIDGLSIGYRAVRSEKTAGGGRILREIELWEVSLVTFPMLREARVTAPDEDARLVKEMTDFFEKAGALLARN